MTPVLSRAQMRAFDARAVAESRVPSLLLMENAGRGAADVLSRDLLAGKPAGAAVLVVCGTGNNGGDGFVVARHLLTRGARPTVVVAGDAKKMSPDARANLAAWRGVGGPLVDLGAAGSLAPLATEVTRAVVVVDALFGTGLDRPIDGRLAEVVAAMNASTAPRMALDVPSGLDADTGAVLGVAVEATVTVTFAYPKLGLLTPGGALLAGRVHVVDIGVPATAFDPAEGVVGLLEDSDVAAWVRRRAPGEHKTSAGHVLILAGSPGKVGAAQLVAHGALRAGAGVATIGTWSDAASAIESGVLEAMTARIDEGALDASVSALSKGKRAIVVGPGFGLDARARAAVDRVLGEWQGPVVVDADALTLLAARRDPAPTLKTAILTPHPGEAARLLGTTPQRVEADRYRSARDLAAATGAVVVLKGAHTIVATPGPRIAVSPVACPALATAGSGDVLAGIIVAMACALPPFEAACAGVMLHARAGEAWSRDRAGADRGMLASEIAGHLRIP